MNVVWSAQARTDLKAISDFIARDSEFYAQQQITRIIQRVERIALRPGLGHPVHEYPKLDMRETHEGSYRIIYSSSVDELRIVTIVHMKQMLRRRRLSSQD